MKVETCKACGGAGRLEFECCDGSYGCSCRGRPVDMGDCGVCAGTGEVEEGAQDPQATIDLVKGRPFLGSGPNL